MTEWIVEPIPGKEYDGRQWGYHVRPAEDAAAEKATGVQHVRGWRATTGGTGPCWNITEDDPPGTLPENASYPMHVCDLDELIAALQALRDSEAHRKNVEGWA